MAIYQVEMNDEILLIEAKTKSAAIAHVINKSVSAKAITASEAVRYINSGKLVLVAGEPVAEAETANPEAQVAETPTE